MPEITTLLNLLGVLVAGTLFLLLLALLLRVVQGQSLLAPGVASLRATAPLSGHEQRMYCRLVSALPDKVILAQVAFSALMTTRNTTVRNRFNRKRTDFVVCTRDFRVLAVVELDDSSHDQLPARDAARDSLLAAAGYRVIRYRGVPDANRIRLDFGLESSLLRRTAVDWEGRH